jgi:hypothetical protein
MAQLYFTKKNNNFGSTIPQPQSTQPMHVLIAAAFREIDLSGIRE